MLHPGILYIAYDMYTDTAGRFGYLRVFVQHALKISSCDAKDIEASKHETKPVLEYEAFGRSHCAHGNRVGPMPPGLGIPLIRTFFFWWETRHFWGKRGP